MAGTKEGGKKAAATNKKRWGKDWYAKIGKKGGKALVPKGFALNPELAREAGARGGKISRRGHSKNRPGNKIYVQHRRARKQSVEVQHD